MKIRSHESSRISTVPFVLPVLFALVIVAVLPLVAGYIVLVERKVMADMQVRLGPMRVGPHGLLQPIADAVKLLLKEDIIPESADKADFLGRAADFGDGGDAGAGGAADWSVLPDRRPEHRAALHPGRQLAGNFRHRAGRLGVQQPLFAAGRAAQRGATGELRDVGGNGRRRRAAAGGDAFHARPSCRRRRDDGVWFIFAAPVGFFIYLVASIAETNRAPFDMPEAESELVAGYMTEYSGFRWALYFLAEYTNMVVVASIATTLFLGGWLRPFSGTPLLQFSRLLSAAADAGDGRVLLLPRAETAGAGAENVHGGGGTAVRCGGAAARCAVAGAGGHACWPRPSRDCTARSGFCSRFRPTSTCSCGCGSRFRATASTS